MNYIERQNVITRLQLVIDAGEIIPGSALILDKAKALKFVVAEYPETLGDPTVIRMLINIESRLVDLILSTDSVDIAK